MRRQGNAGVKRTGGEEYRRMRRGEYR